MLTIWKLLTLCCCVMLTCWSRATKLTRSRRTVIGGYPLCPLGCDSCSSSNGCVTCASGYFLDIQRYGARQLGRCVQVCPEGFYGLSKKDFGICRKCPMPHCTSCTDVPECTACLTPYILHKGQCIRDCPDNLHYASYIKQCLPEVDCILSEWSDWDVCKRNGQTCGYKYGTQSRRRHVLQEATSGGKQCQLTEELRRCRLLYRYCSDVVTNSSEPRKSPCFLTKRGQNRRRKGRGKWRHLRRRCRRRRRRRHKKRRNDKAKSKKASSIYKQSSGRRVAASKAFKKLYYDVPNLKTNQIDGLLTKR